MNSASKFDESVAAAVAKMPKGLSFFFRTITNFGALSITAGSGAVTAYLLWSSSAGTDAYRDSGGLMLVFFGAGMGLKVITHRQRPDTLFVKSMRFKHFSFPSGHAYGSLLVYGFLAYLAASWPIYILAGALIFLIGLSRLYLGAHFPSDVAGGWLMAGIALTIVILYANHI